MGRNDIRGPSQNEDALIAYGKRGYWATEGNVFYVRTSRSGGELLSYVCTGGSIRRFSTRGIRGLSQHSHIRTGDIFDVT